MRQPGRQDRTYVVTIGTAGRDLQELARYLSTLQTARCEVVILDPASGDELEEHRRVLRWVGRHVAVQPTVDRVRAAVGLASCEKVIVATDEVRYQPSELDQVCDLLELHEVVEPQEYLDPLPWWGGIEAGRMLVHRSLEPYPDHGPTFAFRRSTVRGLRAIDVDLSGPGDDPVRILGALGAEVYPAYDVFVQRQPQPLGAWLRGRARQAEGDFTMPLRTALFFALFPVALLLTLLGDASAGGAFLGTVGFASTLLAFRGRFGARAFFPLRACLFAPLWVFERSVSVYWALLLKLRGASTEPNAPLHPQARNTKVASGE